MPKLCIDCRHCTASRADPSAAAYCLRNGDDDRSLVNGEPIVECADRRVDAGWTFVPYGSGVQSSGDNCGQAGNWWEARVKPSSAVP